MTKNGGFVFGDQRKTIVFIVNVMLEKRKADFTQKYKRSKQKFRKLTFQALT